MADAAGAPLAMPGLWGIAFGNDAANKPRNTLFYAAGTHDEANGTYGRIDLGATPPILNAPPFVAVTGPAGPASGTVTLTATVTADVAVATVEFFAGDRTSLGVATSAPYSVHGDTTHMSNGPVQITATAKDVDGNVGTSSPVTLTVANDAATATSARRLP